MTGPHAAPTSVASFTDLNLEERRTWALHLAHGSSCLRCLNRVACADGFNRRADWEIADVRVSRFLDRAEQATEGVS